MNATAAGMEVLSVPLMKNFVFFSVANSCSEWTKYPVTWITSCKMKWHKSATMLRSCCSWSWSSCFLGWIYNSKLHGKINRTVRYTQKQFLHMHPSLTKISPLHVRDQLCISRDPSCACTCSTHSTRNLQVACGMGSVCTKSFLLFSRGDEFLLWKCSACKSCFKKKEIRS
jgi:hypothetical protein